MRGIEWGRIRTWSYLTWHLHTKPALKIALVPFGFLIPAAAVFACLLVLAGAMWLVEWVAQS